MWSLEEFGTGNVTAWYKINYHETYIKHLRPFDLRGFEHNLCPPFFGTSLFFNNFLVKVIHLSHQAILCCQHCQCIQPVLGHGVLTLFRVKRHLSTLPLWSWVWWWASLRVTVSKNTYSRWSHPCLWSLACCWLLVRGPSSFILFFPPVNAKENLKQQSRRQPRVTWFSKVIGLSSAFHLAGRVLIACYTSIWVQHSSVPY